MAIPSTTEVVGIVATGFMTLHQEYGGLLYRNLEHTYRDEVGLKDYKRRIKGRLRRDRGKQIAKLIVRYYNVKGKMILEIGSGWGEIAVELARRGAIVIGIEPDDEKLKISRMLAKLEKMDVKFVKGFGEELPYPNSHFDFVVCSTVLEHVVDPAKTLSEMIRVTKQEGTIYLNTPNYLIPYERHYKVFYPPMFPKPIVKLYLRMIGRPTRYIDQINYITPGFINKELSKHPVTIKNIWPDNFKKKIRNAGILKRLFGYLLIKLGINLSIELFITKE